MSYNRIDPEQGGVDVTTTLKPSEYAKLVAWMERQYPRPNCSEAVRAFVLAGLRLIDNS